MKTMPIRSRRRLGRLSLAAAVLLLALTVSHCVPPPEAQFPTVRPDDAGDASFVRQVVPILLGRKVRGYDELKVLTDLIQVSDRETVLRVLMEDPEFIDHWTEVLIDDLRVHREGSKNHSQCFGDPMLPGAPTPALAQFVLANPPSADFGPNFRMTDLVRSALVLDNLYPIYRAHVFALASRPDFSLFVEQQKRADLGNSFEHVFLNRQSGCLLCHNSEFSTSGEDSGWDRTHPVPGEFEAAIYGSSQGTSPEQAFAIFRTDFNFGSLSPWGSNTCGTFDPTVGSDPQNVGAWFTGPLGRQVTARNLAEILHFGYQQLAADGLDRALSVTAGEQCEFCDTSCAGVDVDENAPLSAVNAAAVNTILQSNCTGGCHDPGGSGDSLTIYPGNDFFTDLVNVEATPDGEVRVIPGDSANSYLIKKLEDAPDINGSRMPLGSPALPAGQIDTIRNWIDDIPSGAACNACDTLDCDPPFPPRVPGPEAVAFLLAERVVGNVWEQAMGYPLTIANYFGRNDQQLAVLWNLTEYQFVGSGWSLKELLVQILTSDLFNRKPPDTNTGTTAYELPMVHDPWVEADPREPAVPDALAHNNAMTDGIYRYTARNLLNSVHRSLGWPAPERLFAPFGTGYPDAGLQKALGQFFTDSQAETKSSDFQGLLTWESLHGVCDKPSGVASDWIDDVVAEAGAFGGPGGPLTLEDLAVLLRDWLLADGTLGSSAPEGLTVSEAQALEAYLGVPLSTEADDVADLEGKLRGLCGVMVETPQFWLAGVAPTGVGPEPRLRVCTTGPCTYEEICLAVKPEADPLLENPLECDEDSLSGGGLFMAAELACPIEICGQVAMRPERLHACVVNPAKCPREVPLCDPRCTGPGCCDSRPRIDQRGFQLAWADGARLEKAEGVRILRAGARRWLPAKAGETLREGDLLAIARESKLGISAGKGRRIATPERGFGKDDPLGYRLVMITGERALAPRRPRIKVPPIDRAAIDRAHRLGWWQWGEAGRPLTAEERRGFVGEEEKLDKDRPDRPRPSHTAPETTDNTAPPR